MYRLMKSERVVLKHFGPMASYHQVEVGQYHDLYAAVAACDLANAHTEARHYILNGAGQEYYGGSWIS
jgi:hypothetical protein